MTVYKEFSFGDKKSPLGSFGPLIGLILFFVIMYFLVKGLFTVLSIIAPVLLILALILDHTVITDYIKFIFKLLKENPLFGLVSILLTIMGFPFVIGFLCLKAWGRRSIRKYQTKMEQEKSRYDRYVEVEDEKVEEEDFLVLPTINKSQKSTEVRKENNDYDNLFK